MEAIDINNMTPVQLAQIEAQIEAKKKAEKERQQNELKVLNELEDETVRAIIEKIEPWSNKIIAIKREALEMLAPLIDMKIASGKARPGQEQYQFKTDDTTQSIAIRYNKTDKYDDGINVGVGYAKQWLEEQADTVRSRQLVGIIDDLLSRDRKGNFSPADLLKFIKSAKEIGDELMLKAADAVEKSIYEEATSVSLLAYKRDELGVRRQLPLSATKA